MILLAMAMIVGAPVIDGLPTSPFELMQYRLRSEIIAPDDLAVANPFPDRPNAGVIGLGVAVDYALEWGMDAISDRVISLADKLRIDMAAIPGVTLTDIGHQKCGITTFIKDGVDPGDIKARLDAQLARAGKAVGAAKFPADSDRLPLSTK